MLACQQFSRFDSAIGDDAFFRPQRSEGFHHIPGAGNAADNDVVPLLIKTVQHFIYLLDVLPFVTLLRPSALPRPIVPTGTCCPTLSKSRVMIFVFLISKTSLFYSEHDVGSIHLRPIVKNKPPHIGAVEISARLFYSIKRLPGNDCPG